MSAAALRRDDAGLLLELLTPRSRPRSPLNKSFNPLGRSGSLQRSRKSPSSLPFLTADRELSTLLGRNKAFPSASPEIRSPGPSIKTCNLPQNQQPQAGTPQTASSPPKSAQNANHTTASYLSFDATQTRVNQVETTSDPSPQSDHNNNNGKHRQDFGPHSDCRAGSKGEPAKQELDFPDRSDEKFDRSMGNMSVVLEKCKLVPELRGFDSSRVQEDVIPDNNKNPQKSEGSSSQREEEAGREGKGVVWCVTGVCEAAEDPTNADNAQTDQCGSDKQPTSDPANRMPSEAQSANEKPVPEPISSQPVPASHPASSPRWRPADSANKVPEVGNDKRKVKSVKGELGNSSTKNLPTSKTRPTGKKQTADKSNPVRTLTNSENFSMRRVVPIIRTKRQEKPSGVTILKSSSSFRKPSTAPSSRRPSVDQKDQKVSRDQNQDLQRKPSIRKPMAKPRAPPEEKICRSTLRALSQASGSISAPVTPSHKPATPSSSPLPGFARNTAASSFRQTPPPQSPSSFSRTGSLRVSATSASSDSLKPSSPLRRTQSIRAPPARSPIHDPAALPKGHRRNDSGTFSEKSTHSRDSGKPSRPTWR